MLYEDKDEAASSADRFHVELHFSPGNLPCVETTRTFGLGYRPAKKKSGRGSINSKRKGDEEVIISYSIVKFSLKVH